MEDVPNYIIANIDAVAFEGTVTTDTIVADRANSAAREIVEREDAELNYSTISDNEDTVGYSGSE